MRPWTLARVAGGLSPAAAFFHSALSLSLAVIPAQAFRFGQIAEPYRDLAEYYRHVGMALAVTAVSGTLLSFLIVALITGAALLWQNLRNSKDPPGDGPARAVLLNISALLIPLGAWLAAYVLSSLAHPAFGLLEPKPAPTWSITWDPGKADSGSWGCAG